MFDYFIPEDGYQRDSKWRFSRIFRESDFYHGNSLKLEKVLDRGIN
jgi:hypothetical protein